MCWHGHGSGIIALRIWSIPVMMDRMRFDHHAGCNVHHTPPVRIDNQRCIIIIVPWTNLGKRSSTLITAMVRATWLWMPCAMGSASLRSSGMTLCSTHAHCPSWAPSYSIVLNRISSTLYSNHAVYHSPADHDSCSVPIACPCPHSSPSSLCLTCVQSV